MKLECSMLESNIWLVRPTGDIVARDSREILLKFRDMMAESQNYVFDLSNVDYFCSETLGTLVKCLNFASEQGGGVKICGLSPTLDEMFKLTRAYMVFDVLDNYEDAVASFEGD